MIPTAFASLVRTLVLSVSFTAAAATAEGSLPATVYGRSAHEAIESPTRIVQAGRRAAPDSMAVVRAVESFRGALARGDSAAALALLAPDVIVLESGDVERLADYRAHHLGADIAFARAVTARHVLVRVTIEGNTAWVTSTSVTRGTFEGRAVNSAGAELIVLSREGPNGPWGIRAIHWSSHRRSP
jgi:ketosteroid isomerase-like protein